LGDSRLFAKTAAKGEAVWVWDVSAVEFGANEKSRPKAAFPIGEEMDY
jgi:hypothetical protein